MRRRGHTRKKGKEEQEEKEGRNEEKDRKETDTQGARGRDSTRVKPVSLDAPLSIWTLTSYLKN